MQTQTQMTIIQKTTIDGINAITSMVEFVDDDVLVSSGAKNVGVGKGVGDGHDMMRFACVHAQLRTG